MHSAGQTVPTGPLTEAQQAAINHLLSDCVDFVSSSNAQTPADPLRVLGCKAKSYWGEPVYVVQPITIKQVEPTLPKPGVAGSVDICRVLDGQIRDQLRYPASLLLPESEWPPEPPEPKRC